MSAFRDLNDAFRSHVQIKNKHEASVVLFHERGHRNEVWKIARLNRNLLRKLKKLEML